MTERRTISHTLNNVRGFTLLELLIAVAVFAVVSALSYSGLSSVLKTTQRTQEVNGQFQEMQLAVSVLQQDMVQIINRAVRDEFGDLQPGLKSGSEYDFVLRFTRSGWRNPAQRVRSSLQRVGYRLDEKTLVREHWQHLDRSPNAQATTLPLLENVNTLTFRFLNDSDEWVEQWPPVGIEPADAILPKALEMHLDTAQWGEIVRLFPLI